MQRLMLNSRRVNTAWHVEAKRKQQDHYTKYGDRVWWSGNPRDQTALLQENLALVLYGPPKPVDEGIDTSGYTNKQSGKIKGISKKICKYYENEVSIALVFVCACIKNQVETRPLFRVWDSEKSLHFDTNMRVYHSWQSYIKENNLPPCQFCAPVNGRYMLDVEGQLKLEFRHSPSSRFHNRLLNVLDVLFIVLAIVGLITGIVIKSLEYNPLEDHFSYASIAVVSCAAFFYVLRFIYAFYDMIKHS